MEQGLDVPLESLFEKADRPAAPAAQQLTHISRPASNGRWAVPATRDQIVLDRFFAEGATRT